VTPALLPHSLWSLALWLGALGLQAGAQEEEDTTRIFALPTVRDTRELAATADEHLRAGRYNEGVQALQRILEEHGQEVLPAERPGQSRTSYPGAVEWVLERMYALPDKVRAEYQARHEPRARAALERARLVPQRAAFAAIPRQWPLVPAAVEAWWSLGDLELEAGQLAATELAWRRAMALGKRLGLASGASAQRQAWLDERAAARAAERPARVSLPRADAEPWTTPLDLAPFVSPVVPSGRNLQPLSVGDTVLVCTTLRMYALDAFTGEPRWQAGPPPGWGVLSTPGAQGPLFEGLMLDQLFLAPAAGDGVAVAVLQQPFTENESDNWQGIPIMTAIPERRLHAYELESGHELWNHAPRVAFDGLHQRWDGTGSYAQRMMVAGSPVISGGRVLVPCYRMQGRIDYHVACYELSSGQLLWSTLVISGQRERNMFGRSMYEFCAAPLVVVGDRVLAQTELGTLAALDLFTGHIQWQTTYPQLPLPKTKSYSPQSRKLTWSRLAPPVVVGELVVTAPSDSNEILALRVADGTRVWSYREDALQSLNRETESLGFNHFVGADADTIYLSGGKLSALQKPGGLASSAPFSPRWTRRLDRADTSPRAVLAGDWIVAPNAVTRVVFDRLTGEPVTSLSGPWPPGEPGSLWLDDGALFSLSIQGLSGYFDWPAQLERARRLASGAARPEDLRAAAELFLRRGRLSLSADSFEEARKTLGEARALFARLRASGSRADAGGELACARALAEALSHLERQPEALAVLAEARPLAVRRADLAALLFQQERILAGNGGPARLAVLDELEATWGELALPEETGRIAAAGWLASFGGSEALEPAPDPLPTALWTSLERAREHERAGALGPALTDLHRALARSRGLQLARGFPAAAVPRARIARILAQPGGREAYASIEALAAEELAAASASGDAVALEALCETYPHARAADEALSILLARTLAARDPRAVAALVGRALARGGLSATREDELLLVLARALAAEGNTAFERDLVAALARTDPTRPSPLAEHRGATLGALAAELAREPAGPAPLAARFDKSVVAGGKQRTGQSRYLGALRPARQAPESEPFELHLWATRDELEGYSNLAPGQPLWKRPLGQALDAMPKLTALAPGRLVYATRSGLACLDERGHELWTRPLLEDPAVGVAEASGVVVALTRSGTVIASDSLLGVPLWERALGVGGNWSGPLLGDGHAVFFSELPTVPARALVLDLFRGRVTADVPMHGFDSRSNLASCAWIAEGRLVAPSFQLRPQRLAAFELDDGKRAWGYEFGPDEDFHALVHSQGHAYAITLAAALGPNGNGGIYELDERMGSLRLLVPLKAGERLMGLDAGDSRTLDAPWLFAFTYAESGRGAQSDVKIRALQLPNGVKWTWNLPIASQDLYDGHPLPMPAVSDDTVAIAYQMRRSSGGQGAESTIVFLDKVAGTKLDTLLLGGNFAQASRLELVGVGEALFVVGKGGSPRGNCLEILEKLR
jgi:outer membrane protein assembly factor BamB